MPYTIIRSIERPEIQAQAAWWFHEKWDIPQEAYLESMMACLNSDAPVPAWYLAMEDDQIIGGLGVIDNDFHERKDLAPNICALYVEEDKRCNGIAGELLRTACADMKVKGIDTLYLVTEHTSFYERYGWEFLCPVNVEGEAEPMRMYVHHE